MDDGCSHIMDEFLFSDVVRGSSVSFPVPQKLLSLIGITCHIPARVYSTSFVIICEVLPACIHFSVIQLVVDIAVRIIPTECPALGRRQFFVSVFSDKGICTTHIVIRNGHTRRSGFLLVLNICPAIIELVCTIPTLFP